MFTIQSDFALKEATVTDLMGRTVIRTTLNNSFQAELDASTWPTGPYVLELLGTDRSVRKVVVRQ
ncbi:MAG: T9SS type A sorting domain-containing protein [Flavobacteriales bacterium]|nr:T9SS type A sorting domain-containing protein [Flavobacteriales bacterium]